MHIYTSIHPAEHVHMVFVWTPSAMSTVKPASAEQQLIHTENQKTLRTVLNGWFGTEWRVRNQPSVWQHCECLMGEMEMEINSMVNLFAVSFFTLSSWPCEACHLQTIYFSLPDGAFVSPAFPISCTFVWFGRFGLVLFCCGKCRYSCFASIFFAAIRC